MQTILNCKVYQITTYYCTSDTIQYIELKIRMLKEYKCNLELEITVYNAMICLVHLLQACSFDIQFLNGHQINYHL